MCVPLPQQLLLLWSDSSVLLKHAWSTEDVNDMHSSTRGCLKMRLLPQDCLLHLSGKADIKLNRC